MKKPLIGIVPLVDTEKESYWMLPGYMQSVEQAGGIPVMLPLTADPPTLEQLASSLDGFLFTGGQDVSPSVYHMPASRECGECCPERDAMESLLLQLALEKSKPVLGICRGIQLINALLGGDLYQDLPTEHASPVNHHQSPPYDRPVHTVSLVADTPLQRLLGTDTLSVNSYHHQAVRTLSRKLQAMAYSEDGLVEAVCLPTAPFVWAVQWHPEFSYGTDEPSRTIVRRFVDACRPPVQGDHQGTYTNS